MANNCLVTKLKGVVDNENLEKLGVITLEFKKVTSPNFNSNRCYFYNRPNSGKIIKLRVISGESVIVDSGGVALPNYDSDARALSEFNLSPGIAINGQFLNKDFTLEVTEKYSLNGIMLGDLLPRFNLDDFYSVNFSMFSLLGTNPYGDLKAFGRNQNTTFNDFSLASGTNYTGCTNKQELINFLKRTSFSTLNLNGCSCINGYDFGELIQSCGSRISIYLVGYTEITGNINSLLDGNQLRYPSIRTINITSTPNLTKNQQDIDTLRSLGVSVSM